MKNVLHLRVLAGICLWWLPFFAAGQDYQLVLHLPDSGKFPPAFDYNSHVKNSKEAHKEVRRIYRLLREAGYLSASVDSIQSDSLSYHAWMYAGHPFSWATLGAGNVEEGILASIGFHEKRYAGKPLRPETIADLMENILVWCEEHGYPFAEIKLDSISFTAHAITARLSLKKHPFITIDSLVIKGDANIHQKYIRNYLGMKPGMAYRESLFKKIPTRIKENPFLSDIKAAEVIFTRENAHIYLYLKDKKANILNGMVGLLPDDNTDKLTVTGELRMRLLNGLGRGELFDLNWRKLQTRTQDLKLQINYPYLFNTPLGTDLHLKIFRKDSTYLQVHRHFGLGYLFKGNDYIQAYVEHQTSNILKNSLILQYTSLPPFANVSTNAYGLTLQRSQVDYLLNPTKGFIIRANGNVGLKTIARNDSLEELNPGIYDAVVLRSTQYQMEASADFYLPIGKRNTINLAFNGGHLFNPNMFRNEMFRIGGIHTLRGFDEEAIFASAFGIFTMEYRFLPEQNSNFYAFIDYGYYERREKDVFLADRPYGFGVGVRFDTKAGIFSVNYALGRQSGNPILFRAAKIHFGFVNYL